MTVLVTGATGYIGSAVVIVNPSNPIGPRDVATYQTSQMVGRIFRLRLRDAVVHYEEAAANQRLLGAGGQSLFLVGLYESQRKIRPRTEAYRREPG